MMKIGIIGGSGLEDPKILKDSKEIEVVTKFGKPSSPLKIGKIGGIDVVILSRHGKKHSIHPGKVNYRANIMALKEQGCTHIIATTAVGSLREDIMPGHLVFPDQFIDRTTKRLQTFYDKNRVCHIPMSDPFCPKLRKLLSETASSLGIVAHRSATVITIEGPRFSTRAESKMFRIWGADVINMSVAPECILANEAGIPYAAVAMSTDYDSWKDDEKPVTWKEILKIFGQNVENVKKLLLASIPKIK